MNMESETEYKTSQFKKEKYGEIITPIYFVKQMLDLLPVSIYKNSKLKWLDTGCGTGIFIREVFSRLITNLTQEFPDEIERRQYILNNMLYVTEINTECQSSLRQFFATDINSKINAKTATTNEHNNIFMTDFLTLPTNAMPKMDIVIGNPPYNRNGLKKTPTDGKREKQKDGETCWHLFVKRSLEQLKPGGKLLYIMPSIWLKEDKKGMYDYMLSYRLTKMHCLNNTATNKVFSSLAQTPTVYFLLEKRHIPQENSKHGIVELWDTDVNKYIKFDATPEWSLTPRPIPCYGASIVNKLSTWVKNAGYIQVMKTNTPSKKATIIDTLTNININSNTNINLNFAYKNIKTCKLQHVQGNINTYKPTLVYQWSDIPLAYYGEKKIVLAHKQHGFPFLDLTGEYGISSRDNYVILTGGEYGEKTETDLHILCKFLSTKFALYMFETTRYRMKYLEKYAFELIPDITQIPLFTKNPEEITDDYIADFFNLTKTERNVILSFTKRIYLPNLL
jgi:hypothetical protein